MFLAALLFQISNAVPFDPLAYPGHISLRCPWAHFDCDPSSATPFCVTFSSVRNCIKDCPNGSDESCGAGQLLCDTSVKRLRCGQCVPSGQQYILCADRRWSYMCNDQRAIKCATTQNCVLPQWLQDGKDDCGDGSDEDPCGTGMVPCAQASTTVETLTLLDNITETDYDTTNSTDPFTIPDECETGDFRCGSGECINGKKVLDEKQDCRDGSDEDYCKKFGNDCRMDSRPCSYQPDIASFGCGCPRGNRRTEVGMCIPK